MKSKGKNILAGIIKMHPRGFGFVTPHQGSTVQEDVFIPPHRCLYAVEGDEVEVRYYPSISDKGIEGEVVSILKRSRRHVAGTLIRPSGKESWIAYIPLFGPDREMIVTTSQEAKPGARMVFEVTHWGTPQKRAQGRSIAFLGDISDGSCDVQAAIEEFELTSDFSQEVQDQVAAFSRRLSKKDLEKREDFTQLETFTIDPDTSKDFDDALSLQVSKKGYTLYVHIADVSHYVKPKTPLDQAAFTRCNSIYLPGTVIPMLPPTLSDDLCSLKPKVKRLTVTVVIELDLEGVVQNYRIVKSVIKSHKRFTYREAKKVIDGKAASPHSTTLKQMVKLCGKLKEQRTKRGAIEFAMPDLEMKVDAKGNITDMEVITYDVTHQMVEEFMLKANELVAISLYQAQKPLTYRIHEEPHPEKLRLFSMHANYFGFRLPAYPTNSELQALFDEIRESPFGKSLVTAFVRTMKLAQYSTQNIGHYGLMLEHYTHFTSPIRRYVDLIVHRLLFDDTDPHFPHEKMASQCSEKERSSARAESSVTYLKKLRYLYTLIQNDPKTLFEAMITSVKPAGFSFEIPSLFMEGFITTSERLNTRKQKKFVVGSTIQLQAFEVDLITRVVQWKLVKKSSSKRRNNK